jgi:hypothetical protein
MMGATYRRELTQGLSFCFSFFKFCSPCGVLKDGTSPREGIFCGGDPAKFTGPGVAAVNVKAEDNEYLRLGTEAGTQPFILDFSNHPGKYHLLTASLGSCCGPLLDGSSLFLGTLREWMLTSAAIMDVVKRIKPDWADPILFKRQLLRSNIPGVGHGLCTCVCFL